MNSASSSSSNMDEFLTSLEDLPAILRQNLTLMRNLDSGTHNVMQGIDKMTDDYFKSKKYLSDKNNHSMDNIQRQFEKAKEFSDDKVQLAIQTYALVDDCIRKLDSNLAQFNTKIENKVTNVPENSDESSFKRLKRTEEKRAMRKKKNGKRGKKTASAAVHSKTLLLGGNTKPIASTRKAETGVLAGAEAANLAQILDMPVDPNEPKFCLCNQVSFGQMIGCDNPDCPIEWFHFVCVKLSTKPKGKWFCPICKQRGEKK
ncbi:inhibitor of growth protein 4-like [Melanaphis sacchari]|uniref:inhibitor of growth protein 4-like n=1 Tax=Melanaphis sacchari TaxID=742174 RepID=UPI000DC136C0|nr:inhibitor of growth protein 4-like [Melanaphis sacchari]